MGLESVEFIMEVESEFGISIPDATAERLRTVGEVADYVVSDGGRTRGPVVQRLREIASKHTEVPLERITEATRFVEDLDFG